MAGSAGGFRPTASTHPTNPCRSPRLRIEAERLRHFFAVRLGGGLLRLTLRRLLGRRVGREIGRERLAAERRDHVLVLEKAGEYALAVRNELVADLEGAVRAGLPLLRRFGEGKTRSRNHQADGQR